MDTLADKKKLFKQKLPNAFFLDATDNEGLYTYLFDSKLIDEHEQIMDIDIPGDGNMNYVLRVITNQKNLILKQARPWVEKYPQISAPMGRIEVESSYYKMVSNNKMLKAHSPKIIKTDLDNFIMIMEDLGDISDLSKLYDANENIERKSIRLLAEYLAALHHLSLIVDLPENMEMKKLNHAHIFDIPFSPINGLKIDGLNDIARSIHHDESLKSKVKQWGDNYLNHRDTLIHGDFYPGSMMYSKEQLYVIDPEFSFVGIPAFDIGVFVAHLHMAQQTEETIKSFIHHYAHDRMINEKEMWSFAGIEILRRMLGVAQLPLVLSINEKRELIERARSWIS